MNPEKLGPNEIGVLRSGKQQKSKHIKLAELSSDLKVSSRRLAQGLLPVQEYAKTD